jgi:hypothetical protein
VYYPLFHQKPTHSRRKGEEKKNRSMHVHPEIAYHSPSKHSKNNQYIYILSHMFHSDNLLLKSGGKTKEKK